MNLQTVMASFRVVIQGVFDRIVSLAPALLAALGLVLLGWFIGRLLSRLTTRLVDRLAPNLERRASRLAGERLGIQRRFAEVMGTFVFWVVVVIFVAAGTEVLGLPLLATWLNQLSSFLPQVLLGGLIVLAGLLAGALVRDTVATAARAGGIARGEFLGRVLQVVIVVAAVLTGVEQVGFDSQFLTAVLTVALGAALGGTALAFALGTRNEVSNLVAMHYVRQSYQVGQRVLLADVHGLVRELRSTAVVLETETGQAHVPGKLFSEHVAYIEGSDDES